MPHFTLQIVGSGPIVLAYVSVSEERANALKAAGQPVPAPVQIRALVDTGATQTNVTESILTGQLGLVVKNVVQVGTASTDGDQLHTTRQYDAGIVIPGSTESPIPLMRKSIPVLGFTPHSASGFQALIGRDILGKCVLVYNGSLNQFILAF